MLGEHIRKTNSAAFEKEKDMQFNQKKINTRSQQLQLQRMLTIKNLPVPPKIELTTRYKSTANLQTRPEFYSTPKDY